LFQGIVNDRSPADETAGLLRRIQSSTRQHQKFNEENRLSIAAAPYEFRRFRLKVLAADPVVDELDAVELAFGPLDCC
jgi:hypothetical protein